MKHEQPTPVSLAFILVLAILLPGSGWAQQVPPVVIEERGPGVEQAQAQSQPPVPLPSPTPSQLPAPSKETPPIVGDQQGGFADRVPLHHSSHPRLAKHREANLAAAIHARDSWFLSGYNYGPRVAPAWGYPGLGGGPFIGYPFGYYGYPSAIGDFWSNGLSLYGPPVPVYGPIPGMFGNNDLVRRWEGWPSVGFPFGWVGLYAASPRPRPLTVNAYPMIESVPLTHTPPASTSQTDSVAGALVISVKVPQPYAEVFVDGKKTNLTGSDRIFESPPLEAGKQYKYEITARWIEGGAQREAKKAVVGSAGEVVRVDFTTGN